MTSKASLLSLLCGLLLAPAFIQAQATETYRYELSTRSGEPQFAGTPREGLRGRAVRVTRDAAGRVVETSSLLNGRVTARYVYHYEGTDTLATAYDSFDEGVRGWKTALTRSPRGNITRRDYVDSTGKVVAGWTRAFDGNVVREEPIVLDTTAFHIPTSFVYSYSPAGLMVRGENHVGAVATFDFAYDESTGRAISRRDFYGSKQSGSASFTYGERSQVDETRDSTGKVTGITEYLDDMKTSDTKTTYDGVREKRLYTYTAIDLPKATKFFRDDKLICTFSYEYGPKRKILRTVARGPNGEKWAVYPACSSRMSTTTANPPTIPTSAPSRRKASGGRLARRSAGAERDFLRHLVAAD
jgi:hypothetical protein